MILVLLLMSCLLEESLLSVFVLFLPIKWAIVTLKAGYFPLSQALIAQKL